MAHAWKACWVQALEGSNPSSSASQPRDLTRNSSSWLDSTGRTYVPHNHPATCHPHWWLEQRSAQAQSPSRRLGQRRGPPATDAFKWLGDCRMVVCELCRRLRVGELAERSEERRVGKECGWRVA